MRVKIREITSQGLDIVDQALPKDLDLDVEFLDQETPIVVSGHLEKVDEFVLARVQVTYALDMVCALCLDPVEKEVSLDLELEFEFSKRDDFIDLGERVREEILVGYSPRIVCREDCKGICKGCGAYLNTETCECDNKNKAATSD